MFRIFKSSRVSPIIEQSFANLEAENNTLHGQCKEVLDMCKEQIEENKILQEELALVKECADRSRATLRSSLMSADNTIFTLKTMWDREKESNAALSKDLERAEEEKNQLQRELNDRNALLEEYMQRVQIREADYYGMQTRLCDANTKLYQQSIALENVKEAFKCPITQVTMVDPVVTNIGHSFEKEALIKWVERHGTNPLTNGPLSKRHIYPNFALRDAIAAFNV
jgi:hypothetical protein